MKNNPLSMSYFNQIDNHPWLNRLTRKMTGVEKEMILEFLDDHLEMNRADFEITANRLFIDKSEKPKRWKEILEVLITINSMRFEKKERYRK